ncbi:RNA polymerase sigma factor (sigma-70 family) [Prosthecobacter fusiformis]|uniref:RNA polymerase sigma factor (Sigma-70 family) n=1 Tax=Prosthecobacter fusiformis TaxID=48464 RepID=A0A4R7RU57_9BACT|nr:sigma-70 family RNA polymerase sigma factor [Prosthecobacter fusiformis]TDU69264.1 RNA polymerase sigma factor (sigma-70 family) [Prosthecobacter fusiformis]
MNTHETRAAQLFLTHHDFVKGVALKYAPWPGLMEDIAQQVFLEFMAKEERWDLENDLCPLLATMTRHVAMRLWRDRTKSRPEVVQKLADHIRLLAEESELPPRYEEEVALLRGCLQKLPEKSRELIQLYYYSDIGTPQIAEQMEMKADTVCRALSRVRDKLRECIQRQIQQGGVAHV